MSHSSDFSLLGGAIRQLTYPTIWLVDMLCTFKSALKTDHLIIIHCNLIVKSITPSHPLIQYL